MAIDDTFRLGSTHPAVAFRHPSPQRCELARFAQSTPLNVLFVCLNALSLAQTRDPALHARLPLRSVVRREGIRDMQPTTVLGSRLQSTERVQAPSLSEHRWNRVTALWAI